MNHMNQGKTIAPERLIPMDLFAEDLPLRIDLAYAQRDNLLFGEAIYRRDARLWLHEDLAAVVLLASGLIHEAYGFSCVLYDGLRTTDAQEAMLKTQRVKDNPHWLEEPRLLSPPGAGAHPRAMAIDLSLETSEGALVDMGTPFDDLSEKAHRDYEHSANVMKNRNILHDCMVKAARLCNMPLLPLPQEWWDFRLPPEMYENYDPLSDSILPPQMRLMNGLHDSGAGDFDAGHFEGKADNLMNRVKALV